MNMIEKSKITIEALKQQIELLKSNLNDIRRNRPTNNLDTCDQNIGKIDNLLRVNQSKLDDLSKDFLAEKDSYTILNNEYELLSNRKLDE